jgi:hypothetical protein
MDDGDKPLGSGLPISGSPDFHAGDLLALQHLLSETEPLAALYTSEIIDPRALRFVPETGWSSHTYSLQTLHTDYFGRKNNVNRRFEHKLWNALRLTSVFPNMIKLVGVVWVTDSIIKVYKYAFAKLLNIAAIDGGLFHKQGNFTRHGFVCLSDAEAKTRVQLQHLVDVDYREVVLITHQSGQYTIMASELDISACRWDNPTTLSRVASLRMDPIGGPNS